MPVLYRKPTSRERNKYRAAEAAGLLDRVLEVGWAGLSAKESGRIGGILAHMDQEKTTHDVR
ncbi:MAG: spore protein [Clostridiales bacterium]|nr:spore protein [Clostridiales bacterium]MDY4542519.1 spore protein [Candidatus Ventricola sp.]